MTGRYQLTAIYRKTTMSSIIIIIIAGTEVEQLISIDCAQLYFLVGCAGVDLDLESPYLILSYTAYH